MRQTQRYVSSKVSFFNTSLRFPTQPALQKEGELLHVKALVQLIIYIDSNSIKPLNAASFLKVRTYNSCINHPDQWGTLKKNTKELHVGHCVQQESNTRVLSMDCILEYMESELTEWKVKGWLQFRFLSLCLIIQFDYVSRHDMAQTHGSKYLSKTYLPLTIFCRLSQLLH